MSNALVANIVRFVSIYLAQVLILFYINLHQDINLFIYPLFILLLPFRTPHALLIGLGFVLGLLVGIHYNAAGIHAAATVLVAFLRPAILNILEPRGGYDSNQSPNKHHHGFTWFLQYSAIAFFIHFVALFTLEVFAVNGIVIVKTILSFIISMIIVILLQVLFNPKA